MIKTWSHLTQDQRCQIAVLSQENLSNRQIAKRLKMSHTSINKELSRNRKKYNPYKAHALAKKRRSNAQKKPYKLTRTIIDYIDRKLINDQWSPEQITAVLALKHKRPIISYQTIYRRVYKNRKNGGNLYKNLRRKGKKYIKRYSKQAGRHLIPGAIDIKERPAIVNLKERFGDLEIDLIVGKDHKGFIITIVDRMSKLTWAILISHKHSEGVADAVIERLKIFKPNLIHTITSDNGKEFAAFKRVEKALGIKWYFATPYRSCERGLNENTNGLIRQYFQKKTIFTKLYPSQVREVEHKLNSRPRKTLGYKTPLEICFGAKSRC